MTAPSNPSNPEAWAIAIFQVVVDKAWDGIAGWRKNRKEQQELEAAWKTALEFALRDTWERLSNDQKTALQKAAQAQALTGMATITEAELMHSDTTAQTLSKQMVQFCKLEGKSEPPQILLSEALAVMLERFKHHLFAAHNDYRLLLAQAATVESANTLKDIRDGLQGIRGDLDTKPSSFPEAEYRASILREFQQPTFAGIVSQEEAHGTKDMTVINLFVDLEATHEMGRFPAPSERGSRTKPGGFGIGTGRIGQGKIGTESDETNETGPTDDLNSIAREQIITERGDVLELLGQYSAVVIRGGPGAGKSTLLRYLLCKSAQNELTPDMMQVLSPNPMPLLPIMIPVREYVTSEHQNLLDFIAHRACKSGQLPHSATDLRDGLEQALNEGRCLICVDGLDEIATDEQGQSIRAAITQWRGQYVQNRFVVTTRIAGYPNVRLNPGQFKLLDLQELDDNRIQRFLQHWFEIHEANAQKQQDSRDDLWEALEGQPTIQSMGRNPLLLTIIAAVYRKGTQLPSQRVRLYERCMELLLESWVSHRGQKLTEAEKNRPFYLMLEPILREIAWTMQVEASTNEERLTIHRETMENTVTAFLYEDENTTAQGKDQLSKLEARAFMAFIEKRVGLLNDNGNDTFSFVHPSFQEYLTAQRIYENRIVIPVWDEIKDRLYDPKWREVILLTMGIPTPKLGLREALPTKLLEEIQKAGENDALEEFTHRHLDLQLAAIADLVTVTPAMNQAVMLRVFKLFQSQKDLNHTRRFNLLSRCKGNEIVSKYLHRTLDNQDWKAHHIDRINAAQALSNLGEKTRVKSILLDIASNDKKNNIRINAAEVLGNLGEKTQATTILLDIANNDKSSDIRINIAEVLGNLGEKTQATTILLDIANNDKDSEIRWIAVAILGELAEKTQANSNALLAIVNNDKKNDVRSIAIATLGKLTERNQAICDVLLTFANNEEEVSEVRISAAKTLGEFGEKTQAATILLNIANNEEEVSEVRISATQALGELGEKTQAIKDALIAIASDDESSEVRIIAAKTLGELGEKIQATTILLNIANNEEEVSGVRINAAEALGELGEKTQATTILFDIATNDEEPTGARSMAAEALGNLGEKTQATTILFDIAIAIGNKGNGLRSIAGRALGRFALEHPPIPKS
jgi:HEAT repeat protein